MGKNDRPIKVSIIMPSLNVGAYIEEALQSVRGQTICEIEILCIDAGSVDGTWEIIQAHAKGDNRITAVQSAVKSYGAQVNMGIAQAHGEYVAILETDDFVSSTMYGALYDLAKKTDADIVKADYKAFFSQDNGEHFYFDRHSFSEKKYYDRALEPRIAAAAFADGDWYLWQGIYKRDFLIRHRIVCSETAGAAFQDIGFLFWTETYAKRAYFCRDSSYRYRIDRQEASSNTGNGLLFAADEYRRIIGELQALGTDDAKVWSLLYHRMAKSFVTGYGAVTEWTADERREKVYEWFCGTLRDAVRQGYISERSVTEGRWKRLTALLESEDIFFSRYGRCRDAALFEKGERFVIFGCGDYGYRIYRALCQAKKEIVMFLDNNPVLQGKRLNGIPIAAPDDVLHLPEDATVIIANEAHYGSMKEQLIRCGVPEERIRIVM